MMTLEELYRCRGINPCPENLDAFWDRSVAQMEALDHSYELIPSAFQVPDYECLDLYFTGIRGARIHGKVIRPKQVVRRMPALVRFHGYSGHAEDFS